MLVVNKSPKVGLYYIILRLILAINLKMKSGEESLLDFKEIIEGRSEFQNENQVSITQNWVG